MEYNVAMWQIEKRNQLCLRFFYLCLSLCFMKSGKLSSIFLNSETRFPPYECY